MSKQIQPVAATPGKRTSKPKLPPPHNLDALQRYTLPETNAFLRQSNAKTYNDIKAGKLRIIKDGDRTYVPGSELVRRSSLTSS